MNKESFLKIFNKDNGNKKNIENAIFLIVILVITVIAINFFWTDSNKKTVDVVSEALENNTESVIADEDLEKKIKSALTKVLGVGKVEVVLTYKKTSSVVPVFNEEYRESTTDEKDSAGGVRNIKEITNSKEIVYEESGGEKNMIVEEMIMPEIEGALIVVEGANNAQVKKDVSEAVSTLTGLPINKICVLEMK